MLLFGVCKNMGRKQLVWTVGVIVLASGLLPARDRNSSAGPDEVKFAVAIPSGRRQFYLGEVIPIELTFTSTIPNRFHIDMANYDRSGRMNSEHFEVEPRYGWSDPLSDYFNSGLFSFMGGGIRGIPQLGSEPRIFHLDLNEWVRFDRPGHYKLTITSSRVIEGRNAENSVGKHIELTSNTIELDVIPADVDWSRQEVVSSIAVLDSSDSERRPQAVRVLRSLGTDVAVNAMVELFRGDGGGFDGEYMFGLIGAPDRKHVVEAMREGLENAEHPITPMYLRTLVVMAYRLDHAEPLTPPPAPPHDGNATEGESWRTNVRERKAALKAYVERYLNVLAESLPKRRGHSFGAAMTTILVEGAEAGVLTQPEFGGFLEQLRSEMPRIFPQLPAGTQSSLLNFWWEQIRSPEMVPVLQTMYQSTPDFTRGTYLKLIADVDLKLARELVMEDMRRPNPTLLYDEIEIFDNELLPIMDNTLAGGLAESARQSASSLRTFAMLIQRHATSSIASKVKAVYTGLGNVDCGARAQLIAYFLRVDFEFGKSALEKIDAPTERHGENGCALSALDIALEKGLPRVEDTAIARLQNPDPYLAAAAAGALQSAGTEAAERHLFNRLTGWHERWQGQADELSETENEGEAQLGTALIEAITRGKAWLKDGEKLEDLRSLCVTREQCERIATYRSKWDKTPELEIIVFNHEQVWPHIAQYEMQSLSQLWQRLKQFPSGTTLTLIPKFGPDQAGHAERIVAKVKKFGEEHGMNFTVKKPE